jgi:hypothetical protein
MLANDRRFNSAFKGLIQEYMKTVIAVFLKAIGIDTKRMGPFLELAYHLE